MLFVLAALLLIAWIVSLAMKVTVGFIHLLLVLAVILFVVGFVRGRGSAARTTAP
jgi:hypothetical protein